MKPREAPQPELPAWRAFVVQLSKQSGDLGDDLRGRLEHLSSGRRTRFESAEELVAGMHRMLREVEE